MGDDRQLRRYAEWVTTRRRWTVTVVFFCVWCSVYVFLVGKGTEDARKRLPESTAAVRELEPEPIPDVAQEVDVTIDHLFDLVPVRGANILPHRCKRARCNTSHVAKSTCRERQEMAVAAVLIVVQTAHHLDE